MKIAVLGAGAVGGYYGGRLVQSGAEVHFLYRSEYQAVQETGLHLHSVDGDWSGMVHAWNRVEDMPACDVALVAFKSAQADLLGSMLPAVLGDHGTAVCLMNGLGHEEICAQAVGAHRVLAGAAFICAERGAPGHVHHFAAGGMTMAPYFDEGREVLEATAASLGDLLRAAHVSVPRARDGRKVKWGKLVWNVPFSGLSIFLGGVTTDRILGEHHAFAEELMWEVLRAARSDGVVLDERMVSDNLTQTAKMGAYRPSILVDFEKHRPTEHEAIVGEPLRRASRAGIETPRMQELYEGILRQVSQDRS